MWGGLRKGKGEKHHGSTRGCERPLTSTDRRSDAYGVDQFVVTRRTRGAVSGPAPSYQLAKSPRHLLYWKVPDMMVPDSGIFESRRAPTEDSADASPPPGRFVTRVRSGTGDFTSATNVPDSAITAVIKRNGPRTHPLDDRPLYPSRSRESYVSDRPTPIGEGFLYLPYVDFLSRLIYPFRQSSPLGRCDG